MMRGMRNRASSLDRGVVLSSAVLILYCWACGGCSHQPPREDPPAIDPAAASQAAIELYDSNHDGALSGAELNQCPGIKSALSNYDAGSGKVTAESIAARIRQWQESKIGTMGLNVIVTLDGQELDGATVTLDPEKFLGPNLAKASGVSSAH